MVRLGARLPFAQVADEMRLLFGVSVSPDTVRRLTEQAGALQASIEERELEQLEHEAPAEREGPAVQQVSADGVMVQLVNGKWTEVRTIAIGTVEDRKGEPHVRDLSYFSRRCSADHFIRQATLPTSERGTRRAGTVVAVMDGASWLQELVDEQCPAAVRIVDFPHAVGYLSEAGQAAFGAGSREATAWLDEWASKLKTKQPEEVLAAVRALPTPTREATGAKRKALRYLGQRREQIRYAAFQEQGYPIGSGIVESAGKLVVEARLKGSGMRWSPQYINPVLALRGRLCSGSRSGRRSGGNGGLRSSSDRRTVEGDGDSRGQRRRRHDHRCLLRHHRSESAPRPSSTGVPPMLIPGSSAGSDPPRDAPLQESAAHPGYL